jgi:hypothetical protein
MSGFGQIKNNFAVDDRVVIGQTGPSGLDGRTGVVLGKSVENVVDFYIVGLDAPYLGQKAILMIESCLKREK